MSRESAYQSRVIEFGERESELAGRSDLYSNYRLIAFCLGLIPGLYASVAVRNQVVMMILFLISLTGFGVFAFLVIKHRKIIREEEQCRLLKELNEQAICRLNRDWQGFPVPDAPDELASLPIARDLDLFGSASLFQLLSTQRTPQGRVTLARWLIEPAEAEEAVSRQVSAKELGPYLDFRQEMAVVGESLSVEKAVIIPEFLERRSWLHHKNRLLQYLPYAPWVSLFLLIVSLFFPKIPLILLVVAFHYYLNAKYRGTINDSLKGLSNEERKIGAYFEVFAMLKECPVQTGRLEELILTFKEAHIAMDSLNDVATAASARGSLIHPLLNVVALNDLRAVRGLERWQKFHQNEIPQWFESLGEIEALGSLASLTYDEPEWALPTFSDPGSPIQAKALGHPLIVETKRVANHVSVGPEGRFLLVTGSNMAGKSTLLRSIGLNVILAQAGATVCADALATPPVAIATSMGAQDSLVEGVSFFMAELKRIKTVVNLTREESAKGRTVLFLLDEILQGTNTVERREIVERVIANLVKNKAIGALTTHDLALADSEELVNHADLIHFREHFERSDDGVPSMTFDYKIHPGVATTTNALRILEMIEMPI